MCVVRISYSAISLIVLFVLTIGSALGDSIDGVWCAAEGRRLHISGDIVTTPSGNRKTGYYDAHHFVYVVPKIEPNGGMTIDMVLVNEKTIHLRTHSGLSKKSEVRFEIWTRCQSPTS